MKRRISTINSQREYTSPLEPRVAKLELGMERLTEDVTNLASVVREQGTQMEQEIQKLVVAVTQAAGPKKTDWQTIIAGISLIMAIGAAVFFPLNQQVQENKQMLSHIEETVTAHEKLEDHPLGIALISRLEQQMTMAKQQTDKEMASHLVEDTRDHETLRTHFHEELDLLSKNYDQNIKALENKVDLHNDRLYARVVRIEETMQHDRDADLNELRLWRLRAMNGDKSQLSTDIIFDPHVPKIAEPKTASPQK